MNNKKLFKGALVLFASILMAVSCSAGDKTGGDGNSDKEQGGGTTVTTKTLTKDDFIKKLSAITFGKDASGGIGAWSFESIEDIKAGVAQKTGPAKAVIESSAASTTSASIAAINTAIETEIAKLATSGYKVTLETKLKTSTGKAAQTIVLSVVPVDKTSKVEYKFSEDLKTALTKSNKTVVEIDLQPGNSKDWAA